VMVAFVAEQIGVTPDALGGYAFRPNTKYEHSAALQDVLGWRPFEGRPRREIEGWLDQASLTARTGAELAVGFRDELRRAARLSCPGSRPSNGSARLPSPVASGRSSCG
jgi:Domain of unknown function (DUF4158)